MKKVELLSPVGNQEMLEAAIKNGADAIYLAGKLYGARAFADNFSNDEIKQAIKYAHLYGVKVYVTINTLIYENEINDFINYVKFLYQSSVDAVIMQDLGIINLVLKTFPNLEVHASTQLHNHTKENLEYLKKIGVKRAVLARELSLDEIKELPCDIEKEVFVYGALCISYSGQCLASSCILNRSGNRGKCAGMCRLPYELYSESEKIATDGDYLLSPKELNTLSRLREIIDTGVDSLKIEGRMKSPEYVGYVTRIFRRLIDAYYANEAMNITLEEENNLKKLYNRDFTLGHLFKERNYKLMNIKTPNHVGTPLGKAKVKKNKIMIYLDDDIAQGDGIRFANKEGMIVNFLYDEKLLLINKASKGQIVYVDNKVNLIADGQVFKTLDKELMEKIKDIPQRKVNINIVVEAKVGKPLKATIKDDKNIITEQLGQVEISKNCPISKSELVDRFSKLNDTPFILKDIQIDADEQIFIPIKIISQLRRNLVTKLITLRTQAKYEPIITKLEWPAQKVKPTKSYNFYVREEKQLQYLLDKKVNIYVDDYLLYQKYKADNVYFLTDRTSFHLIDLNKEKVVASNLSGVLKYSQNNEVFSDIYLNVTNSYTLAVLNDLGAKKITLSVENDINQIKQLVSGFERNFNTMPNVDVLVYGRVELMVLKHCFLNMFLNKDTKCAVCKDKKQYYLKDRNGKFLPIINKNCNTYILHYQNINLIEDIPNFKTMGINNFSFYLFKETKEELAKLLEAL